MNTPHQDALEAIGFGTSFQDKLLEMADTVEIFRDLTAQEITELTRYMHAYRAHPGVVLIREGARDRVGDLYFVVSGRLDILKDAHAHEPRHLAVVRAGKSIGEMSLVDHQPHSATVVAAEPTTVLILSRMNFERIAEEHPKVGFKILLRIARLMSLRLRQTSGLLADHLDH
jgi:CRP/FNR family cyclic AMP-dependent transcriptional regulator